MIWLDQLAQLEEPLDPGVHIVYKHSPRCGLSALAAREVAAFHRAHPEVVIFAIDVVACQEVSRAIAFQFGVGHESPQAFVLSGGRVLWHASHHRITATAMLEAVVASSEQGAAHAMRG